MHTRCRVATAISIISNHTPDLTTLVCLRSSDPEDFLLRSEARPEDTLTRLIFSLALWRGRVELAGTTIPPAVAAAAQRIASHFSDLKRQASKRPKQRDRTKEANEYGDDRSPAHPLYQFILMGLQGPIQVRQVQAF